MFLLNDVLQRKNKQFLFLTDICLIIWQFMLKHFVLHGFNMSKLSSWISDMKFLTVRNYIFPNYSLGTHILVQKPVYSSTSKLFYWQLFKFIIDYNETDCQNWRGNIRLAHVSFIQKECVGCQIIGSVSGLSDILL